MSADHMLHVGPGKWGGLEFSLTCIPEVGEHYSLWESNCECECEMCTGDDPDHWGCDRADHNHSLDGAAPCQSKLDAEHCFFLIMDIPIEECLVGEFPEDGAPWPVSIDYLGDGDVRISYVPPSEVGVTCRCCGGDGHHYDYQSWRWGGSPAVCHACTRGRWLPDRDYQSCRRRSRSEAPDLDRGA